ncbi:MAG TPA: hypothetical protein VHV82_08440, partial [Sporichthyaceae bacterium]|nr:hypothetical protein [Sporichthyaceae bacterium]
MDDEPNLSAVDFSTAKRSAADLFAVDLFAADLFAAAKLAVRGLPYSLMIRLLLVTVGFMPVTLIAISCWGVPLKYL